MVSRRITQSAIEFLKSFQLIPRFCGGTEKLPQALSGKEEMLDFVSHPDTEGFSTASSTISVGTEDASGTYRFSGLMLGTVSAKETVLDEITDALAMRTRVDFELGIKIIELRSRRTNSAAHDTLTTLQRRARNLWPVSLQEDRRRNKNPNNCQSAKTEAG